MGVAVTGWMGWVEEKKGCGIAREKKVGQNRLIIF